MDFLSVYWGTNPTPRLSGTGKDTRMHLHIVFYLEAIVRRPITEQMIAYLQIVAQTLVFKLNVGPPIEGIRTPSSAN